MAASEIPSNSQILVIGGGPAGAYTASALAREGFQVVLFESAKFPRYHVGESTLPSMRPLMRYIDFEETMEHYGFMPKPGGAFKFTQWKRESYVDFARLGKNGMNHSAWNLIRSEFDELLLRHAAQSGTQVYEETKVTEIEFDVNTPSRPVAALWMNISGETGRISFDYLVDATGRNGIMSTKHLRNRQFNKSLNNVACWGYWTGCNAYSPGTERDNAVWIEALTDESGWAWFIPLHDGTTSIGFVLDSACSIAKKKASKEAHNGQGQLLRDHYLEQFRHAPGVTDLLGEGTLKEIDDVPIVRAASDYSYAATSYAGDHFRLVGDAAAFIDPFFSSGVHLALSSALSAAITVSASIRNHCTEAEALGWHHTKVANSYTRFLFVIAGAYKQIRNQDIPIMSDVNEDSFDRAFQIIRPVIIGAADVDKALTEVEMQKTMDFCRTLFISDPDPPVSPAAVAAYGESQSKIGLAQAKTHALNNQPLQAMWDLGRNVAEDVLGGLASRVEHGKLGLVRV